MCLTLQITESGKREAIEPLPCLIIKQNENAVIIVFLKEQNAKQKPIEI